MLLVRIKSPINRELEGLESVPAQQALNNEIKKVENAVMPIVNKTADKIGSVISAIGNGIKSAWNSLKPGSDRGGSTWTTKEHSGGDQSKVPKGKSDGGGNVDALIAPTLRADPAKTVAAGVAQGVEMVTTLESQTHVIETTVKSTNVTVGSTVFNGVDYPVGTEAAGRGNVKELKPGQEVNNQWKSAGGGNWTLIKSDTINK